MTAVVLEPAAAAFAEATATPPYLFQTHHSDTRRGPYRARFRGFLPDGPAAGRRAPRPGVLLLAGRHAPARPGRPHRRRHLRRPVQHRRLHHPPHRTLLVARPDRAVVGRGAGPRAAEPLTGGIRCPARRRLQLA
ncbi:hypothetical protein C1I98_33515 [Spongiactinospora gelatinilytica]|uniref:Uncharacterized protein n=1 Tax=Spongiactinospora gelatinilytica TaxID=2666298 RepID=A0A2W2ERV8_9ACTN|nr:hypothetical protein C1I98_33515 [Spongiactinospora gelatinilytica]